ncbi:large ribosomal subunit protein mL44-like [Watersipora subatra]|uniref:large ribosomal subunit protein mL44-like n=1 Tax=Watersipora subatra TaxID=2589382 RepID=UPI00355B3DAC
MSLAITKAFVPHLLRCTSNTRFGIAWTGLRHYKQHKFKYLKELYYRRLKAGIPDEVPRNKQPNWNYHVELYALACRISTVVPIHTLQLAFVDKSYAVQMKEIEMEVIGSSEGDLVTEDDMFGSHDQLANIGRKFTTRYVEEYLVSQLPHLPSDGIQALVNYVTSGEKLAHVGERLGLSELVMLRDGLALPPDAVAKSLLAVIALIKDEEGQGKAECFVRDFLISQLVGEDLDDIYKLKDGMTQLEGVLAKLERGKPEPRLIDQFGQETLMACYYVGIYSDKQLLGKAVGESPEVATEMAARDALMTIYGIQDNRMHFDFNQEHSNKLESSNLETNKRSSVL